MGILRIVGLGPSDARHLTLEALQVIHGPGEHILRTAHHGAVSYFHEHNIDVTSFDDLYEEGETFDAIYEKMVEILAEKSRDKDVNFYVPGHPLIAERAALTLVHREDVNTEVISGMSFLEPMLTMVGRDPIEGLKLIDGDQFHPTDLDRHVDTIVTQVYNQRILSELKIALGEIYGDDFEVFAVSDAGIREKETLLRLPVYALDRDVEASYQTSLFIPRVREDASKDFTDLLRIVERLRSPEGCPWDAAQTHESLAPHIVEEACELSYALKDNDVNAVVEELGDVLFHVLMQAQIGAEEGEFFLQDVTDAISQKLIHRHPHVFSDSKEPVDWEALKDEEKEVEGVEETLRKAVYGRPAFYGADVLAKRLCRLGFRWEHIEELLLKVHEELKELEEAISERDEGHIREELGDFLLMTHHLTHFLGYNAEDTLHMALEKTIRRMGAMESLAHHRGANLAECSLEEMEALWQEVKASTEFSSLQGGYHEQI